MELIIGIAITAGMYMIYPLYKFTNKYETYTKKEIRKTLIINSIVVFLIDTFLAYAIFSSNAKINPIPMFFYFFINCCIWYRKASENTEKNTRKEETIKIDKQENEDDITKNVKELRELKKLLDENILTKEEFDKEKAKILNNKK